MEQLVLTILTLISLVLTVQAAHALYLMIYTWDRPEAGEGAGARSTCYAGTLLHRHPPGTARGGGHPAHHRPRRVR